MLTSIALTLTLLGSGLTGQHADTLDWRPCPGDKIGMTCGDLQVPVDWQKPGGRKITLKLGRLQATGRSEGNVLVAYGGPGGPGIALTQSGPQWWADLRKRMDLITWDTRGYGEQFGGLSTGLPCVWTRIPVPVFPRDDADFGRLSDTNQGYAEACRHQDPELFAHMSSADHARDMEAIRKALGDAKLNFYGSSYAGTYGQTYLRLFPQHVRTMVLDGTWNHSTTDWPRELEATAKSNEATLNRFFTWCDTHRCQDLPRTWRTLVAKADRTPIPAKSARIAYDGRDLQSLAIDYARQGPSAWPKLAQAIRQTTRGDASAFVPERGGRYPGYLTGVTECTDWPRPTTRAGLDTTIARLRRAALNTGAADTMATATLACVGWPVPVTNPPAALPKGLPPLLGAGAWGESDAAARALAQVPGSAIIHHDGPGHTLYAFNTCARDHINRYLTDRVLPPSKTTC
ncbi:alpha/beta fold hydrolase [Nonomuraea sp. 10N515B]|uniref:alpha/beta fold hydrolase n=1 Tax=Nonomuraea sp. 10N515B TaxID=3457422 RepID=UPI003FCDB348